MWFDTYDFARRVEYFGIGKIGNRRNAPKCKSEELAPVLKQVILGETAKVFVKRAAAMAEACRAKGDGCKIAASGILDLLKCERS